MRRHGRPLMGVMAQTHQGIEAVIKVRGEIASLPISGRGGAVTSRSAPPPIIARANVLLRDGSGDGV